MSEAAGTGPAADAIAAQRPRTGRRGVSAMVFAPVALAILAEAAWTAIVAGLLQAFVLREPTLGIPGTLLACLAGVAAAHWIAPMAGERWSAVAVALTIGVGALGWLSSPEVWSILAAGGLDSIGGALVANIGGWVAAIAFLRGIPYARLPPDPGPIGTALAVGTPGIAFAAIVGGMVGDPWRTRFIDDTGIEVVVFLVAGIASLTLSRLTLVGAGAGAGGVDWRRNPAWLGLSAVLLAVIAGTAIAASNVAGPVIVTALGVSIPSLLVLGFVVGFDRRSLRIVAISVAIALLVGQALRVLGEAQGVVPPIAGPIAPNQPEPPPPPAAFTLGLAGLGIAVAVIAIVVLIRMWMLRSRVVADVADEDRWIDRGEETERVADRRRRRGVRLGRGRPPDAVTAYRTLLEDLAARDTVRRQDGETPAEHAARLREAGVGGLALDLLAADYGLVRFGGVRLTEAEDRRGIERASRLRRILLARAASLAGQGPRAAARPGEEGAPEGGPGTRSRFRVG